MTTFYIHSSSHPLISLKQCFYLNLQIKFLRAQEEVDSPGNLGGRENRTGREEKMERKTCLLPHLYHVPITVATGMRESSLNSPWAMEVWGKSTK